MNLRFPPRQVPAVPAAAPPPISGSLIANCSIIRNLYV